MHFIYSGRLDGAILGLYTNQKVDDTTTKTPDLLLSQNEVSIRWLNYHI